MGKKNKIIGRSYYKQSFPGGIDRQGTPNNVQPSRDYSKFLLWASVVFVLIVIAVMLYRQ